MQIDTMTLRELTVRYSAKKSRDGQPIIIGKTITRPTDAVPALMTIMQDEPNEVFAILCLTTKCRVIAYHEVGRGILDATLVEPRGVFTAALLAHAAVIVAVHVHPSGDPTPSRDDLEVTQRLAAAGRLLGIELLDHIIIGDHRCCSLKELGRL
jgi:DNA repair protein RadC